MAILTPDEVREIAERADAAPPGPYEWEDRPVFDGAGMVPGGKPYNLQTRVRSRVFASILNPDGEVHPCVHLKTLDGWEPSPELAAFIAAARDDVPAICASHEALRAERDRAKFMPIGDNHHNALLCPYCNPHSETLSALADCARRDRRIAELEAELAAARRELAEARRLNEIAAAVEREGE